MRRRLHHPVLVGLGLMLVAFNLRPALSTIGPLLNTILAETALTATGAALLTTLPVFCLGLAGTLGPAVIRRAGFDLGVLAGILAVALGLALRGLGDLVSLFLGSALASAGIGLTGVLLPGLVKRDFPHRAGLMTGFYTMVLCLGAAAGAGLTVPLLDLLGTGWAPTLAAWCLPAFAAALIWAPFTRRRPDARPAAGMRRSGLSRDGLAWQVTGFMGLQSSLAYITFGWLPALLQDRGLSALDAGFVASVVTLAQAPSALLIPTLAVRMREQRGLVVGLVLVVIASFLGLVFGPMQAVILAGIVFGFSLGGCFGLGLTIIVLRARDAASVGALSAMAQSIGYAVAALGPLGFGLAREASGGWGLPSLLFCALALGSLVCGLGAGRDRHVGTA